MNGRMDGETSVFCNLVYNDQRFFYGRDWYQCFNVLRGWQINHDIKNQWRIYAALKWFLKPETLTQSPTSLTHNHEEQLRYFEQHFVASLNDITEMTLWWTYGGKTVPITSCMTVLARHYPIWTVCTQAVPSRTLLLQKTPNPDNSLPDSFPPDNLSYIRNHTQPFTVITRYLRETFNIIIIRHFA